MERKDYEKLREKAKKINEKGNIGSYIFRPHSGFAAYSKKEEPILNVIYECQYCEHEFKGELEMKWPYKVKCEECGRILFKSTKPRGRRRKKKKKKDKKGEKNKKK